MEYLKIVVILSLFISCADKLVVNKSTQSHFTLVNNLDVLIVSNPKFINSTAAVAVNVGHLQNPQEHAGLAHFIEHALFLGTKSYPKEGEFDTFLGKNGAPISNAYTSYDTTNYHFEVNNKAFPEALHRFSEFFYAPKFSTKFLDKEKNAVNSEFKISLKKSYARTWRIIAKSITPSNPWSRFSAGNNESLKNVTRQIAMNFYKKHYFSSNMKLVIMGSQDIETLKNLATKYFSSIPDRTITKNKVSDEIFKGQKLPKLHKIKALDDNMELSLLFNTPNEKPLWQNKPFKLISSLIGNESTGSLTAYLKRLALIKGVDVGAWNSMYSIDFKLTKKGEKNFKKIIEIFYSYVQFLKSNGIKEYIYNDQKNLAILDFKTTEYSANGASSSTLAQLMTDYNSKDFLQNKHLFYKFNAAKTISYLDYFKPTNMQVYLSSKNVSTDKIDKLYDVQYSTAQLKDDFLKNINATSNFSYPKQNNFITKDLSLVAQNHKTKINSKILRDKAVINYQVDTILNQPKSFLNLSFSNSSTINNVRNNLLAQLFVKVKTEELSEWGYNPKVAGMSYSFGFSDNDDNKIDLKAQGYSENLALLLKNLISNPNTNYNLIDITLNNDKFEIIKNSMKQGYIEKTLESALNNTFDTYVTILTTHSVSYKKFAKIIDSIKINDVQNFAKSFFNSVNINLNAYGNIKYKNLENIIDYYYNFNKSQYIESSALTFTKQKYVKFPNQNMVFKLAEKNNNNAMLTVWKFGEWNIKNNAIALIISKIISAPYYDELRTKQQLGYAVGGLTQSSRGYAGFGGYIQSDSVNPNVLLKKNDEFYSKFVKNFDKTITEKSLATIKKTISLELLNSKNKFSERLNVFYATLTENYGDTKRNKNLSNAVKKVTKQDILKALIKSQSKDTPRLSIFYFGTNVKNKKFAIDNNYNIINSIDEFKSNNDKINPYLSK